MSIHANHIFYVQSNNNFSLCLSNYDGDKSTYKSFVYSQFHGELQARSEAAFWDSPAQYLQTFLTFEPRDAVGREGSTSLNAFTF